MHLPQVSAHLLNNTQPGLCRWGNCLQSLEKLNFCAYLLQVVGKRGNSLCSVAVLKSCNGQEKWCNECGGDGHYSAAPCSLDDTRPRCAKPRLFQMPRLSDSVSTVLPKPCSVEANLKAEVIKTDGVATAWPPDPPESDPETVYDGSMVDNLSSSVLPLLDHSKPKGRKISCQSLSKGSHLEFDIGYGMAADARNESRGLLEGCATSACVSKPTVPPLHSLYPSSGPCRQNFHHASAIDFELVSNCDSDEAWEVRSSAGGDTRLEVGAEPTCKSIEGTDSEPAPQVDFFAGQHIILCSKSHAINQQREALLGREILPILNTLTFLSIGARIKRLDTQYQGYNSSLYCHMYWRPLIQPSASFDSEASTCSWNCANLPNRE